MYQALYRKWRPKTFSDVVGQEHVTETLQRQVAEGRLSHAYLFTGTRGTGKTTCAKILAKAVNCEHPENGNPCNKCQSCLGIESGGFLDVMELDAASNNGVDHVRALRDEAIYSPAQVKKRVYIIDEVHMLSIAAFNALLKILEEPPEHLMFILATTELNKVPATILSRCQRFSFRRLRPEDIAGRLNFIAYQEGIQIAPAALRLLSRLADGAMRDGVSLLDQCASACQGELTEELVCQTLGLAGVKRTGELLMAAGKQDTAQALSIFEALYAEGKDLGALFDELSALSILEADAVLRLMNCDLKSVSYLSSQQEYLKMGGFDFDKLYKAVSNVKPNEASEHMEQVLGKAVFTVPHSPELEAQVLAGTLLADLGLKDSRGFRKEIEKISKEVFEV